MDGLEPTLHVDVRAMADVGGTIPDLEPTSAAPVDAPEDRAPDLEPTAAAPVDADGIAIPDLERTHAELPGDAPTALPLAPVCRYCRTPAVPGERMCSRCGMKLPTLDPQLVPAGTEGLNVCQNCATVTTREMCPACGARMHPTGPG
jgi:RNA polymerase subunit RPABC4/transcription elongation factor Spt4